MVTAGCRLGSGITSDPNRADDEWYIVDLVGISLTTVEIVARLPEAYSAEE
jgi:ribosomal 30S subunit maturation factor RimM